MGKGKGRRGFVNRVIITDGLAVGTIKADACKKRRFINPKSAAYRRLSRRLRGWKRLSKPGTKISKDLVLEFYTNGVRTEEELASGEDYPYTSFVRGTEVDFSAAKIRKVLRIKHMTLVAETNFKTRQYEDQRLDEVARPITAKVMTTIRGRIINQPQNQPMEEDEEAYDAENLYTNHEQNQEMHYEEETDYEAAEAKEDNYQYQQQPNFEASETNFQQYKEDQQQRFQFLNEELASMKIRQEQFFENMQKAQSQYLDELKSLRTRQDEMVNQQNNFYRQIKREQEKTIKEIE
ncbi:hypothetical protein PIB30_081402 [Stylosanthes scabra]|uniref:Uncharacterized protein n=1 Tax=Stylosanthes scabra TaxID=79078 RepID=A0ABU6SS53_9FABA|nr:hypothetical protein [Stylosanthes scabra]